MANLRSLTPHITPRKCLTHNMAAKISWHTWWAKKRGHRLMAIIVSNLSRFTKFVSLEHSIVNSQ